MNYVIYSFEHGMWWGPNRCGYVISLDTAGRYSRMEAAEIVVDSIFCDEIAMPQDIAEARGVPQFHPYTGEHRSYVQGEPS